MKVSIQKWPTGLLSFLVGKGGEAPATLGDEVLPVMNLEHFYAASDLQVQTNSGAALSAVDTGVNITVPANQSWRLWSISATMNGLAAGNKYVVSLNITPPGGSQVCILPSQTFTSSAAASNYRIGMFVPQPVILVAGSVLAAVISEAPAAGNFNMGLQALIQQFNT